jgi:carboxypeptidase C (cathepsin A)
VRFAASLLGNGKRTVTRAITVRGTELQVDLTLGAIELKDPAGKPSAYFVYTAYTKRGVTDRRSRPVTFVWGGGPSGPASGDHFRFGPHRNERGSLTYWGNTESILDCTDLVMVDPIATGWSVPAGTYSLWDFYSVAKDAASIAQFIQRYIDGNRFSGSPLYLKGQSYGTIRLPVVLHYLGAAGMRADGLIFISSALNGFATWQKSGNHAPYYLKLPNYAAWAWRDKRQSDPAPTAAQAVEQAGAFALNEYVTALLSWPNISDALKRSVLTRLESITGITQDVWARHDIRMDPDQFRRAFTPNAPPPGPVEYERRGAGETPMNALVRTQFGLAQAPVYRGLAPHLYVGDKAGPHPWDTTDHGSFYDAGGYLIASFANYHDDVAAAMKAHPTLRVQQHSGYYDLGCNSFSTNWSWQQMDIPPELRKNIELHDYEAGHGVSEGPVNTARFLKNVVDFYKAGGA